MLGWIALALIPLTALGGWYLRRYAHGTFIQRMRPHIFTGYAAAAIALVHTFTVGSKMGHANLTGIWLATFALLAIIAQVFLGANLQSAGGGRRTLRRWHVATFVVLLALAIGHTALNTR